MHFIEAAADAVGRSVPQTREEATAILRDLFHRVGDSQDALKSRLLQYSCLCSTESDTVTLSDTGTSANTSTVVNGSNTGAYVAGGVVGGVVGVGVAASLGAASRTIAAIGAATGGAGAILGIAVVALWLWWK